MTTRTESELAADVLRDLGVIAAEADPSALDSQWVIRRYRNILDELTDDGIAYWSADAIPLNVYEGLIDILALTVGPSFGRPWKRGRELEDALAIARRRIRARTHKRSAEVPAYVDDF